MKGRSLASVSLSENRLDDYQGISRPIAEAAEGLLAALKNSECGMLPFADPEQLKTKLGSHRMTEGLLKDLARSKERLPKVCETINGQSAVAVSVRVDDIAFVGKDATGKVVGIVKGDLQTGDDEWTARLRGFRAVE